MIFTRIKDLRIERNKTEREIATMLGCSIETYRSLERGNRKVSTMFLIKLSSYYETNVDYIVGLTDESKPYPSKQE